MTKIWHIGVDEVGRGPLAGPVTVCAFAIEQGKSRAFLRGITDSKQLSMKSREEWYARLQQARKEEKVRFALCSVSAREIDTRGIASSIRKAVSKSLASIKASPASSRVFLDGSLQAPGVYKRQQAIIGGDGIHKLISAASVVAKVHRDRLLDKVGSQYPEYGFEKHKGYGTEKHIKAIKKHGISKEHRKTFCRNIV